jgi:IPT/TIG domain/FG-GAP-like repeat
MSRFLNNLFKRLTTIKNKPRRLYTPPQLTYLEDRITPVGGMSNTFVYNGTVLTIDLKITDEALTLTSQGNGAYVFTTSVGTFSGTDTAELIGNGTSTLTINSALTTLNGIDIIDTAAGTDVSFGTNAGAYVDNFSITLDEAGASVVTVANATSFTGTAGLNVAAARNISITADITTATGDIVLDADNGVQQTGFFTGVIISGTGVDVTTSGGNITIEGRGGDNGDNYYGVYVQSGAKVQAGDNGSIFGAVSVTGTGGEADGNFNVGVWVDGTGSKITSSGGSVTVIGTGGGVFSGEGNRGDNYGVELSSGGEISAGGTGTVSVTGTGGSAVGDSNHGVKVENTNSKITSSGGSVTIIGIGGGRGASDLNYGVELTDSGEISAGGTGTVSVTGTGGRGVSTGIELSTGTITTNTSGAAVTLTADSMNFDTTSVVSSTGTVTLRNKTAGVAIDLGTETAGQLSLTDAELDRVTAGTLVIGRDDALLSGAITVSNAISRAAGNLTLLGRNISITADLSTVTGDILLDADNGVQQTGNFEGVSINGTGVDVTTGGGNITIAGRGGDDFNNNQFGVYVLNGAKVQAGDNGSIFGTVSVTGTGGAAGGGFNYGVLVSDVGSKITSSGGSVTVIGIGGGTGATTDENRGLQVDNGGEISAGGTGTVSVTGTGGAAGGDLNYGVNVDDAGSIITSSGGSVTIIGIGGGTVATTSDDNRGLEVGNGGKISAGLLGTVSVTGTGGAAGGDFNHGVKVENANSIITSSGGSVTIIGIGGGTSATTSSSNRGIYIVDSGKISAGLMGTVSVTGTGGAAGGDSNIGVRVQNTGSIITSSGGNVTVTGTGGGTGTSSTNRGIYIFSSGEISAGGTGTVSVTGIGGVGVSTGIELNTSAATITTNSSGAAITLTADSMAFDGTSVVSSTGTVTLQNKTAGVAIDLGTETTGQLSLTDTELDRVTAGTLVIGRSGVNPGVITVSNALTLPSAVSALQLIGPAGITLNNNVTTTGSQTYTGAVTLGTTAVTLTGTTPSFSSTVTGAGNDLILNFSGVTTIVGGNFTGIKNLITGNGGSTALSGILITTGNQTFNDTVTLGANTTLNAGSGNILLPGTVSNFGAGTFSLTPITSGAGLTTISGPNTNTTTNVTTGVVQINNTTASTTNFAVSGGTLIGTGSIGNLTGTGTGIIAPGNSPGLVTTTNLSLSPGNTLQIEINNVSPPVAGTNYDQIVVSSGGTVALGSATLSLSTTFAGSAGTIFTIIDNQGASAVSGIFSGLIQGAVFTANGKDYQISYIGGTGSPGNDVTLTVVAAPTVTNISPAAGPIAGGTSITITGTDFTGATAVTIGGTAAATFAFVNSTTITATTPAHAAGTASVVVTTLGGTNSANTLFTYAAAPSPSPSPTPTPTPPTPTPTPPTPTPTAPLVVGTPPPTSSGGSSTVTLYDPVTGAEAGTAVPFPGFNGPVKVASGDFNSDGVAELVAGAGFGGGPAIAILNSQTGAVMQSFFAFDPAFTGGVFVAVQDTNGDGILDIIAAAGPGGGPEVRIFNGANLNLLRSFYAYAEDFRGGVSVASIDFNGDGILDLVTGAGPGGGPHVKVFDGATNSIISQWYAYPASFTGGVFVAVGDIGNDGSFEVVTGAGLGGAPVVAVWDPFTGALLAQFMAYSESFTGGVRVGINDGNSDGVPDILTGAGPGGGPQVNVFNFPALDLLFSFYSGEQTNTGGVFVA